MRNLTIKTAISFINVFFFTLVSLAQGNIDGYINDSITNEKAAFITVSLMQGENILSSAITDSEGYFFFKKVDQGTYDIKVSQFEAKKTFKDIHVITSDISLSLTMDFTQQIPVVTIVRIKDIMPKGDIEVIDSEFIAHAKPRVITEVEKLQGTTVETPDGISYKGARPGTAVYYIDGIRTYGQLYIPMSSVREIEIYSNGIPAQFGNTTSAVVVVESKGYFDKY